MRVNPELQRAERVGRLLPAPEDEQGSKTGPERERGQGRDQSLGDLVRRRLGAEALERAAQPLVSGIYASDPNMLSLRATMPRFLDLETKHRSLILGMRAEQKAKGSHAAAESGADVLGVDWRLPLSAARRRLGPSIALQGNLDPAAPFSPPSQVAAEAGRVLEEAGPEPGHIFNLGHGVLPQTPPDGLETVARTVQEWSWLNGTSMGQPWQRRTISNHEWPGIPGS